MRQKVANYKRLRELVNEWVELAIETGEGRAGGGEAGPWRLIAISCRKILLPCGRWWPVYSRSWTPRSAGCNSCSTWWSSCCAGVTGRSANA